ncbi:MAG: sortase [Chloroflexi bacterium]|nr:MAG: sortase [Chloroflexota bacterium]
MVPGEVEEIGPWAQEKCGAPTRGELRGGAITTIPEARSFGRHSSCTGAYRWLDRSSPRPARRCSSRESCSLSRASIRIRNLSRLLRLRSRARREFSVRPRPRFRRTRRSRTPENFAFHLPGTAIPGMGGNAYLYAHARRGMFLALWNAHVGDEVFVSTPDGLALKYVVREIHPRVAPEDTSWIDPTPTERLTLQTSTGPSRSDPRFVVIATPA